MQEHKAKVGSGSRDPKRDGGGGWWHRHEGTENGHMKPLHDRVARQRELTGGDEGVFWAL